ncbi:MAG: M42 family metallopeptidase [Clostridia bacterium]|nr:M42 family metallopeptidase [Clostridia bacterium]
MNECYLNYTIDVLKKLLAADSPTGFTGQASDYVMNALRELGYVPTLTRKGGVLCCLNAESAPAENGLLLSAHIDTLGAMVAQVKGNGRLKVRNIGGLNPNNVETEFVTVYTRDGRKYDGTLQLCNASVHVNGAYTGTQRTWDSLEVLLDENVSSADQTKALGIENGCYVCVNPRTVVTESGYIKSRYLDDKLSAAILLGYAKYIRDEAVQLSRRVHLHFTVYEEVGHGASGTLPEGVTEMLGVDMGCVGDGLECTEKQVSICAADSSGPYDYDFTTRLVNLAKEKGIGYAVDIYPHYSSDCSAAARSFDICTALIGAGVYASHGYERSHVDGVKNTFDLIQAYAG